MIRKAEYQQRWTDIEQFAIDDPGSVVKFSDKLQHQQGWTPAFTQRVITEYKKFLFLCVVVPGGASPSAIIDEAWHLHLTYTVNYWNELCAKVLGKPLHHHPSRGGPAEKQRHVNWYRQTFENYKAYFGDDPPAEIWPPPAPEEKSADLPEKPSSTHLLLLLLPFFFPFAFQVATPFELNGPQFLGFFSLLLACVAITLTRYSRNRRIYLQQQFAATDTSRLNLFQFTRILSGKTKMVQTAAVDLVARDILKPTGKNRLEVMDLNMEDAISNNPVLPFLRKYYQTGETVNMNDLEYICGEYGTTDEQVEAELNRLCRPDYTTIAIMCGVWLIAGIRLIRGWSNGNPTGFLVLLTLVSIFAGWYAIRESSSRRILIRIAADHYNAEQLPLADNTHPLATGQFAFYGIAALAAISGGDMLGRMFNNDPYNRGQQAQGCGGSGCSSGCSSCGGGCGGCGG